MKTTRILFFVAAFFPVSETRSQVKTGAKIARYASPAGSFMQAIPIGNGRLGATIFGGVEEERIVLNDDSFWSGEPYSGKVANGPETVAQIHAALVKGDHALADELAKKLQGPYNQSYQPLEELRIRFDHTGKPVNYTRYLNISDAVAAVSYQVDGVVYTRTAFCSFPDQAIVVQLEASQSGKLNFTIAMAGKHQQQVKSVSGTSLQAFGRAPYQVDPSYLSTDKPVLYDSAENGKGMRYAAILNAQVKDGRISNKNGTIRVVNATSVLLLISARTSFNGYNQSPSKNGLNCNRLVMDDNRKLLGKSYATLLAAHISDYQRLFNRMELKLDAGTNQDQAPLSSLVERFKKENDPSFLTLLFDLGRYLMIAGSRPGSQPLNLQGNWNEWVRPPWSSNYTMNINSQMNYWPVLVANLAECHEPMLSFIEELAEHGRETARHNYNSSGWVAHHNADIWRYSGAVGAGGGEPSWANFMGGGIWESFDFWEHYQFTNDSVFLRNRVYPLLKGAVEFSLDWLIKDSSNQLVPRFTVSSEATYSTPAGYKGYCILNSGQDIALYEELFMNFIQTCERLAINDSLYQKTKAAFHLLPRYQVDPEGKIKEWLEPGIDRPYGGNKNHLSQLIGYFPGRQLILKNDPKLENAVKRTLEIFGPSTAKWMHAWEINLWARQAKPERAYELVTRLAEGYGPNDFNPDQSYQIDWQMGFTAGICEMLLQSHRVDEKGIPEIEVLPALPKEWRNGSIKGIRARGCFECTLEWKEGKLTRLQVENISGQAGSNKKVWINYGGNKKLLELEPGKVSTQFYN
ncbi:glycoside hydrolase family 95 protein [Flavihumibacter sp. CACIAM 22H1]|uniref:glycoside hydrolase family 95 protein n=1 Tax=Flavihumibacter sp. CACIAM 22H1 TaxID=1812911 RepID=UPI0007A9328C|nr:glycoside hydrolase family 95 protein [Flavihumibacter sp. CACIAM 22H1]KYP15990.1 MAG: hypothetical protein A1D16_06940 [Flavihumibacter sp. CACIAM 22H1]